MSEPVWSYDLIAELYATDMGQSMPFDDVGCYRQLAEHFPGRVLELGCGSGRILIELLAAGLDVVGVDRSLPMLQQLQRDAATRGLVPRVLQSDLREFSFDPASFSLILAPYSLPTYLTESSDLERFVERCRQLLTPGGALVLDAFIPRDVTPFDDFRADYSRPHGDGRLDRAKRIACLTDGCNLIERRYRLYDATGALQSEVLTSERIRPLTPQHLRELLLRHGLHIERELFDYGQRLSEVEARFFTVVGTG